MTKRRGPHGLVFWVPVILIGAAAALAWAATRPAAVLDWLRFGPVPEAPVTDLSDVHPGEPPFGASDYSSMEKGNDR